MAILLRMKRRLKAGMVGGGRDAFIGGVHRMGDATRRKNRTCRRRVFIECGEIETLRGGSAARSKSGLSGLQDDGGTGTPIAGG